MTTEHDRAAALTAALADLDAATVAHRAAKAQVDWTNPAGTPEAVVAYGQATATRLEAFNRLHAIEASHE